MDRSKNIILLIILNVLLYSACAGSGDGLNVEDYTQYGKVSLIPVKSFIKSGIVSHSPGYEGSKMTGQLACLTLEINYERVRDDGACFGGAFEYALSLEKNYDWGNEVTEKANFLAFYYQLYLGQNSHMNDDDHFGYRVIGGYHQFIHYGNLVRRDTVTGITTTYIDQTYAPAGLLMGFDMKFPLYFIRGIRWENKVILMSQPVVNTAIAIPLKEKWMTWLSFGTWQGSQIKAYEIGLTGYFFK